MSTIVEFSNFCAIKENGWEPGMIAADWGKKINDPWCGSIGMDDRGYARFEDPSYGVRAFYRVMYRYWERMHDSLYCAQIDRLAGIVYNGQPGFNLLRMTTLYAPIEETTHENNPAKYANHLSRLVGPPVDWPWLFMFEENGAVNWARELWDLCRAVSRVETGEKGVMQDYAHDQGVSKYERDFVKGSES